MSENKRLDEDRSSITDIRKVINCTQEGGGQMAKQDRQVSFTFVNPNTTAEFERQFRRILIEKLIDVHRQNAPAAG